MGWMERGGWKDRWLGWMERGWWKDRWMGWMGRGRVEGWVDGLELDWVDWDTSECLTEGLPSPSVRQSLVGDTSYKFIWRGIEGVCIEGGSMGVRLKRCVNG